MLHLSIRFRRLKTPENQAGNQRIQSRNSQLYPAMQSSAQTGLHQKCPMNWKRQREFGKALCYSDRGPFDIRLGVVCKFQFAERKEVYQCIVDEIIRLANQSKIDIF